MRDQPSQAARRTMLGTLRRLRGANDGVSAVEFAIIAPLMLVLYFGSVELSLLMQADRRVTSASATMGDLTARSATVADNDIDQIFAAAEFVMAPLPTQNARLRISSFVADPAGNVTVGWSDARNTAPLSVGAPVTDLPNGVIAPGGSVIFAEVEYQYSSRIEFVLQGERQLEEEFYMRPRRVNAIPRN